MAGTPASADGEFESLDPSDSLPDDLDSMTYALNMQVNDIKKLRDKLKNSAAILNEELSNSKTSISIRQQVKDLIHEYSKAFNTVVCSYMHTVCSLNLGESIIEKVKETVKTEIRAASRTIINPIIKETVHNSVRDNNKSYAGCLAHNSALTVNRDKVHLTNGQTLPVPNTRNIYIGPTNADTYSDFEATKAAVIRAVVPAEVGLKVINIRRANANNVRLVVESADLEKLKSLDTLKQAGLEIKEDGGLKPRMLVRFVPSNITGDDFIKTLIAMNMPNADPTTAKIIYLYPIRENMNTRNIVIEVDPKLRDILKAQGRVFFQWQSFPVEDHVKILQCFKCLEFGHLARDCGKETACGHCAQGHETRNCPNRNLAPKCLNCIRAKLPNAHSALDGRNCPILKRRIGDKVAQIKYK